MSTQLSPRISIPLTALAPGGGGASEEGLRRHSYDLILFPRYLECLRAPRVRIKVKDNHRGPWIWSPFMRMLNCSNAASTPS